MSDATAIDNGDADQLDQSLEELNLETQKHSGQANRDIERVTDYAEEAQVDADKLTAAMNLLTGPNKSSAENEANAVKISKDDVEVIMRELELGRSVAERALRNNQGQLKDALQALIIDPFYH